MVCNNLEIPIPLMNRPQAYEDWGFFFNTSLHTIPPGLRNMRKIRLPLRLLIRSLNER